jgi:shikimate dehydrogenase
MTMQAVRISGFPSGAAVVVGLLGWPVKHSLSPLLHNRWLRELEIDGVYVPFAVPPERLVQAVRALPAFGLRGVNVTIPHKEAVVPLMDWCDPVAVAMGAVNTIVVEADGRLCGYNTDGYGALRALPDTVDKLRPVAVFGAGGAARAVCAGLAATGFGPFYVLNRTPERAERLLRDLGLKGMALGLDSAAGILPRCGLAINTTAVGLAGVQLSGVDRESKRLAEEALPFDPALLPGDATVFDIVYHPFGLSTVGGLGMLVWQAEAAFHLWFGQRPPVCEAVFAELAERLANQ